MKANSFVLVMLILLISFALLVTGCTETELVDEDMDEETLDEEVVKEPIKIGWLIEQTGAFVVYGYAHELVGKAAFERVNEMGGANGRPFEFIIKNTESNAEVGAVEARRLIEDEEVDFLIGSNHMGVILAASSVAGELKTVYMPTAGGDRLSDGKANRFVFDLNTEVAHETLGTVNFIKDELEAENWVTVVFDYAWGWGHETYFKKYADEAGLNVVNQIRVPIGTDNWIRYLRGNIPAETDGVYFAVFGADLMTFTEELYSYRPDLIKFGANYVLAAIDVSEFGAAGEGMYCIVGYPTWATGTENDRDFREATNVDEFGLEINTGKHLNMSKQWSTWETIHAIRDVIEASGWESKADYAKFIETLENYAFEYSLSYPEGDKHFRAQDHAIVKGAWIEQVRDGELHLVKRLPAESLIYEPMINYQETEPFD
jgi:branched-chain amino acid transport system substrate-binding protein